MTIDPEMLMAYADGELGPIEAKRVERAITEDPELAKQVAQHRHLRAAMNAHFAPIAEEPVPDRLAAMLQSQVVPLPQRVTTRVWPRWAGAIAASLVLGLAIGHGWQGGGDFRSQDGRLYAAGRLASALDRQLAANDGAVRTPVSFREAGGRYCRVFTSASADGIACRDRQGWELEQTRAGRAAVKSAYAQAGSAAPELMTAAQEMMAGEPLDAAAERSAQAAGWR